MPKLIFLTLLVLLAILTSTSAQTDPIRYVPPNFVFLSAVIMGPEYGLKSTSGFHQRVTNWATGCAAVDIQPRITSYLGENSRITVDIVSTTELVGGCSRTALDMAIETYTFASVASFQRSTPADITSGCITLVNGLWMPTCADTCTTWQCAFQYTPSNSAQTITGSVAIITAAIIALIW